MRFIDYFKKNLLNAAKLLYKKSPSWGKVFVYRKHLIKRFKNGCLPPVYLETTNACNLNCIMCPTQRPEAKKFNKEGFMDFTLFRRLINEIASENPFNEVFLHKDGEPLLHPQIVDFIDYASSRLHNVSLATNATLLNKELAEAILSTKLQTIRFSVDGLNKDTFEKIRRQNQDNPYARLDIPVDYKSVINNIKQFCDLKKALGKSFPRVGVRITDFKATNQELADYTSYWKKRVDFVEIAQLLSWSGQVTKEEDGFTHRYPCQDLWGYITISWNGIMVPCCAYVDIKGDGKGILADLNNCSLREAWHSPSMQRLRLAHLEGDLDKLAPFCRSCRDWRLSMPPGKKLWSEKFKNKIRVEIKKEVGSV